MLTFILGGASAFGWGVADFGAGILVRRFGAVTVSAISQVAGMAALVAVVWISNATVHRDGILLGAAAGLFSVISVTAYYRAMSLGALSVVSPLVACGAIIPFCLAIATGEHLSGTSIAGAVITLAGVTLTSSQERSAVGFRESALLLSLVAAFASGFTLYLVGFASQEGGAFAAVLGSRGCAGSLLIVGAIYLRPKHSVALGSLFLITLVGVTSTAAVVLFSAAAERGALSIASIFASLYPVVTIVLAHAFLAERLRGVQFVGVSLALLGLAVLAIG